MLDAVRKAFLHAMLDAARRAFIAKLAKNGRKVRKGEQAKSVGLGAMSPSQFGPFILSLTLLASFSISSAFLITSRERTFSSDLSTYAFSSTESFSSLSVSDLRAATRSLAALFSMSCWMRACASSSPPGVTGYSLMGGGDDCCCAFEIRTKLKTASRHKGNVHTRNLDRTATSQESQAALLHENYTSGESG